MKSCVLALAFLAVAFSAPMTIPEDDFDYDVAYETELLQTQVAAKSKSSKVDELQVLSTEQNNAENALKMEEKQAQEVEQAKKMLASGKTGHFELKIPQFAVGELRKAEKKTVVEELSEMQGHSDADSACACCHQAGKNECYSTKCSDGSGNFCWSTTDAGIHWGWGGEGKKGYNSGADECTHAQMWGKCSAVQSKEQKKAAAKRGRVKAIVKTVDKDEKAAEAAVHHPAPKPKVPKAPKWHEYCKVKTSYQSLKGRCNAYKRFCKLYKKYGLHADAKRHCDAMKAAHAKMVKAPPKSVDHKFAAKQKKQEGKIIENAETAATRAKEEMFMYQDDEY
jgi:hypothetical protein